MRWYTRDWMSYDAVKDNPASVEELREALEAAVRRQLMSDVPYGVLLSEGWTARSFPPLPRNTLPTVWKATGNRRAWWPQLHSFAVGLKGAPDLAKAREVADHIGTVHHEINYTIQEGLDAVRDVIYFIETYDVTTVRASTPMYLLARVIKSMGIKMVLSGEGADEVFGGYLYFHKAPDARAFPRRNPPQALQALPLRLPACQQVARGMGRGRARAFPRQGVPRRGDAAQPCSPRCARKDHRKENRARGISGYAPGRSGMAPERAVQRRGVGYSWIDTLLKAVTSQAVSDEQMAHAAERFPVNTPMNKEEYYYRSIFEEYFPSESAARSVPSVPSVACSTAEALAWDEAFKNMNEPSGRAVAGVHEEAYAKVSQELRS